jgi:hypothetical protein
MSDASPKRQILLTFSETDPDDIELWELMQAKKAEARAANTRFKPAPAFKKLMRDWLVSQKVNGALTPSALWHYQQPSAAAVASPEEDVRPDDELLLEVINSKFDFD